MLSPHLAIFRPATPRKGYFFGLLLVGLLGSWFCLTGCTRQSVADRAAREGRLIIGNGAEPQALDPHLVSGVAEGRILHALFEGLVRRDPELETRIVPGVARSWDISDEGTRYVFDLNPEARWSDGRAVTAQDFLFSWKRLLHPSIGSPNSHLLDVVKGVETWRMAQSSEDGPIGLSAPHPGKLVIELEAPLPHFLDLLTHFALFPLPEHVLRAHGSEARRDTGWTQPGRIVSNGPFQLQEWRVNQRITVVLNPYFSRASEVSLTAIEFHPVENAETEERAFRAGQLHATSKVSFTTLRQHQDRPNPYLRQDPALDTTYLLFNLNRPELADVRIRQALALSTDRSSLVRFLTLTGQPAQGFVPGALPQYPAPEGLDFDPVKARRLLEAAGFGSPQSLPRLALSVRAADTSRAIGEALQAMWREHLGWEVEIRAMEWKVFLDSLDRRQYDLAYLAWIGDYADPATFLEVLAGSSPFNRADWSHPEYDDLLIRARHSLDPHQRIHYLVAAERILIAEIPIFPLNWRTRDYLLHPSVQGWPPRLLDFRDWSRVRLYPYAPSL